MLYHSTIARQHSSTNSNTGFLLATLQPHGYMYYALPSIGKDPIFAFQSPNSVFSFLDLFSCFSSSKYFIYSLNWSSTLSHLYLFFWIILLLFAIWSSNFKFPRNWSFFTYFLRFHRIHQCYSTKHNLHRIKPYLNIVYQQISMFCDLSKCMKNNYQSSMLFFFQFEP